eukprot:6188185-Pleurochrysis_carterae.AAC.1
MPTAGPRACASHASVRAPSRAHTQTRARSGKRAWPKPPCTLTHTRRSKQMRERTSQRCCLPAAQVDEQATITSTLTTHRYGTSCPNGPDSSRTLSKARKRAWEGTLLGSRPLRPSQC